mmetsp:Transcript_58157/g.138428  ORF Transcript_58157/g.138428 Transcript_58157/m.138428 type:complete len:718 (+) Transcript_58157:48-2201(+)
MASAASSLLQGAYVRKGEWLLGVVAAVAANGTGLVIYEDGEEAVLSIAEICRSHWPEPLSNEAIAAADTSEMAVLRTDGTPPQRTWTRSHEEDWPDQYAWENSMFPPMAGGTMHDGTPPAHAAYQFGNYKLPGVRPGNSPHHSGGRRAATALFFVKLACLALLALALGAWLLPLARAEATAAELTPGSKLEEEEESTGTHSSDSSEPPVEVEAVEVQSVQLEEPAFAAPLDDLGLSDWLAQPTVQHQWSWRHAHGPHTPRRRTQGGTSVDVADVFAGTHQGLYELFPAAATLPPAAMASLESDTHLYRNEEAVVHSHHGGMLESSQQLPSSDNDIGFSMVENLLAASALVGVLVAAAVLVMQTFLDLWLVLSQQVAQAFSFLYPAAAVAATPVAQPGVGLPAAAGLATDVPLGDEGNLEQDIPAFAPFYPEVAAQPMEEAPSPRTPGYPRATPPHSPQLQLEVAAPSLPSPPREIAIGTDTGTDMCGPPMEACVQSGPGLVGGLPIFVGAHYVARVFHPTSVVRVIGLGSTPGSVLALPCHRSTIKTFRQANRMHATELAACDLILGPFVMFGGRPPAYVLDHINKLLPGGEPHFPKPAGSGTSTAVAKAPTGRRAKALAEMMELVVDGPRFRYVSKLKQLRKMGFKEEEDTLRSLLTTHVGNLEAVVAELRLSLQADAQRVAAQQPQQQPAARLASAAHKTASAGGVSRRISFGGG